jgi:hypothetical protein
MELALEYGGNTHKLGDVVALIREGKAQFWSNGDGCIVTEVHTFPLRKDIHYWLLFGAKREVLALEDEINEWAIGQGCSVATACGRPGWGRLAAATGWRPWWPNFWRPLTPDASSHLGRLPR